MTESEQIMPLREDEYARVMHVARRRSSEERNEIEDNVLVDRLIALTASDSQERAAYHYAAQTVVAHALGCPVTDVFLRDDGAGSSQWSIAANISPTPQVRHHELLAFATINAAGYVAEQLQWQHARPVEPALTAGVVEQLRAFVEDVRPMPGDVQQALAYIKGKSFMDAAATIVEHQEAAAEAILQANWDIVAWLAQDLQEEGQIAGPQLHDLLSDVVVRGTEGLMPPGDK